MAPTGFGFRCVLCSSLALALAAEFLDAGAEALNESAAFVDSGAAATLRALLMKRRVVPMRHKAVSGEQARAGTPPPPMHEKLYQEFGLVGLLLLLCCFGACCHWLEYCLHEHGHGHASAALTLRKANSRLLAQVEGSELAGSARSRSYESVPVQEINTIEVDGRANAECLPACCTGDKVVRGPRRGGPRKPKPGLQVATGTWISSSDASGKDSLGVQPVSTTEEK